MGVKTTSVILPVYTHQESCVTDVSLQSTGAPRAGLQAWGLHRKCTLSGRHIFVILPHSTCSMSAVTALNPPLSTHNYLFGVPAWTHQSNYTVSAEILVRVLHNPFKLVLGYSYEPLSIYALWELAYHLDFSILHWHYTHRLDEQWVLHTDWTILQYMHHVYRYTGVNLHRTCTMSACLNH